MRDIRQEVRKRILVLDGAMGTMLQQKHLAASAYRNPKTGKNETSLQELVNLNAPEEIESIHRAYIHSGADIIETNTFCANGFSLDEYGLEGMVRAINLKAVEIAHKAQGDSDVYVAGVLGPSKESLSLATKLDDPTYRRHDFFQFRTMYEVQAQALLDGGVDLFLIETVFDTLVAKSAIQACLGVMEKSGRNIPIMVSVTFSDKSGRMLCGQSLESLVVSLSEYPIFSLGCNCSTGAKEMEPLIRKLAELSPFFVSAHPNAGFPDKNGNYQVAPKENAAILSCWADQGWVNILGGCCGTTPEHIRAISEAVKGKKPHYPSMKSDSLSLASLDVRIPQKGKLMVIGERTNVAGSAKFRTLVEKGKWDEALSIARKEVLQGADVLDICMDAPLLDASSSMVTFLRAIAGEPEVNRIPVMIDSSDFSVIEKAMGEIQGRGIINSISLKEGPEKFIAHAKEIQKFGHAMVVMLFDEKGQADSYEKKIASARRSYDLLVSAGIRAENIIIDPNVLAIATGIREHDGYAASFIKATEWIHRMFPLVHVSGGISNLSFAFRGNNAFRSAMHAVFLSLAHLDMAIVNPAASRDVAELDPEAFSLISHALLNDREGASEELISLASHFVPERQKSETYVVTEEWKRNPPRERLVQAIVHGEEEYLMEDLDALGQEDALSLVEGPLMDGMKIVGKLFGEGKMFLPQIVRSARTMRMAVDILSPRIEEKKKDRGNERQKKVVIATVKGDVHDIGKNICSLVLSCNGFAVCDLGVMVDAKTIYDASVADGCDLVVLSGLITPSLGEMATTIRYFSDHGNATPIFVGGATTSDLHTALVLAPLSKGPVIHTADASSLAVAALNAVGTHRKEFFEEYRKTQQGMRSPEPKGERHSFAEALTLQKQKAIATPSQEYGIFVIDDFDIDRLVENVNYKALLAAMRIPPTSGEAEKVIAEAREMLHGYAFLDSLRKGCRAVYGIFHAGSDRMEASIGDRRFHFLRNETNGLCLADFIAAKDDAAGAMVLSSELAPIREEDPYRKILAQLLYDRMVEVLAEETERKLRERWGCPDPCIRPAPGYPTYPDHSEKNVLFDLLDATSRTGVRLTDHYSMQPASSICALVLSSPDARYFAVGPVGRAQLSVYAGRKGVDESDLERLIKEVSQ